MINKYQGETLQWKVVVKDVGGTALTTEAPVLHVFDAGDTERATGTGTHQTTGSYAHNVDTTTSWGTGPLKYYWETIGANGTGRKAETNEVNLLAGTTEPDSYVYESELSSYYSRIGDYLDEHSRDKVLSKYNYTNRLLESLNITAPRQKNANGLHDQSVRDMQAWLAIHDIVQDKQINRAPTDEDPWYKKFNDNAMSIYKDIKDKRIVFRDQVSISESGIEKPVRTAGSSIGTMENNWDRSYGETFEGSDFTRTWKVQVIGTGEDSGVDECTFKWTKDNWINSGTATTNFGWVSLDQEVYVRWSLGTSSGTGGIMNIGDEWKFTTNPIAKQKGGINGARSYR